MTERMPTVLIAGAGPVGLTLAASLITGPCADRVAVRLLEARPAEPWDAGQMDLRVYALSRASQRILERIGAWQRIAAARACAYRRMRVWQSGARGSLEFDSADIGEPDLGHIIEDRLLRSVLTDVLAASDNAAIDTAAAVESITVVPRGIDVTLADGRRLHGTLLIAADGSDSYVRALLAMRVAAQAYGQHALVTHVVSERPHEHTAWQRFLPGGPVALLPLSDGRSSVVWSLPDREADALLHAPAEEFLAALEDASERVLGRLRACSARATFRLRVMHALRYCDARAVLVGDAAHTVHPLAGQGMNLGLLDAACLAEVVEQALLRGEDPGDRRVLRRYERQRKAENLKMLLALHALNEIFRAPIWTAPARSLGLGIVDASPAAKRALMHEAFGLGALSRTRWIADVA